MLLYRCVCVRGCVVPRLLHYEQILSWLFLSCCFSHLPDLVPPCPPAQVESRVPGQTSEYSATDHRVSYRRACCTRVCLRVRPSNTTVLRVLHLFVFIAFLLCAFLRVSLSVFFSYFFGLEFCFFLRSFRLAVVCGR